jgi:hypothetical protein
MLELLDAKDEVFVVLPGWEAASPQALLHRGIYQRAGAGRALPGPPEYLIHEGPPLLTLHPALLDEVLDDLLDPLARRGGGPYLQEDQPL